MVSEPASVRAAARQRIMVTRRRQGSALGSSLLGVCLLMQSCSVTQSPRREAQQSEQAVSPIAVDASEQQIKQAVGNARAGAKLTPQAWPNGARVAVCLSFDVDNEALWRASPQPVPLSEGEYGATTGLPRLL